MSLRFLAVACLALAACFTGCSRFSTRSGTPPILEPQLPPPPKPIEMEIAPPAETSRPVQGVSLPEGTALPARKSY